MDSLLKFSRLCISKHDDRRGILHIKLLADDAYRNLTDPGGKLRFELFFFFFFFGCCLNFGRPGRVSTVFSRNTVVLLFGQLAAHLPLSRQLPPARPGEIRFCLFCSGLAYLWGAKVPKPVDVGNFFLETFHDPTRLCLAYGYLEPAPQIFFGDLV